MLQLEKNYNDVKTTIAAAAARAGRDAKAVRLVAVTKTVGIDQVRQALDLGITDFGENRVQDAAPKVNALPQAIWHFIGHLQSNKVKDVLPHYSMIHSLDRSSLAEAIQAGAEKLDITVDALVQVNIAGEDRKFGLDPLELPAFLKYVRGLERIRICGLMTMAPYVDDAEEVRPVFRELRKLRDHYAVPDLPLNVLSMGMTNDYSIAVEEGATMVRIGSALFN